MSFAQEKFLDQDQPVADKLICLRYNNNAKSPIVTLADIEKSNKRKIDLSSSKNEKVQKTVSNQSPQQAVKETQPTDSQPKPVKTGKEVAVPCVLCLASPDTKKKEKACFHTYENCFDHPSLGEKNKSKFKFGKGKKSSKK